MPQTLNLDAYLERIGYTGPVAPTLDAFDRIVGLHTQRIPFENLNVVLGWPIALDIASLQEKLVYAGRGGYCYEQNGLLKAVLEAIGFRVTGLAARVLWNSEPGVLSARTHMLLRVEIGDRPHIADVGFGLLTPTASLRLESGVTQQTPHERFRLTRLDAEFVLQVELSGEWKDLYRFDLQPQLPADYEVSNWYVSTNPRSHFVNNLVAACAGPGRRYTLNNGDFTVRPVGGTAETRTMTTAGELSDILQSCFGIRLPETPELEPVLERVSTGSAVGAGA